MSRSPSLKVPLGAGSHLQWRAVAVALTALVVWHTACHAQTTVSEPVRQQTMAEEVVVLERADPAHNQPYLWSWLASGAEAPKTVAVLFTGGGGMVGLIQRGPPRPGANFLVRSRQRYVDMGVATAVVDAPSNLNVMSDAHRMGASHAADVAAVVEDVKRRAPGAKVFLVGTSRGTVSAAYAGATLGLAVDGVVLTSSVFNASKGGAGLSGFNFKAIKSPLLLVHHVQDTCFVTPYAAAKKLAASYPLVTVRGGEPAQSEPCEAFSPHGYLGVEGPAVAAMVQWMRGQPAPIEVP